MIGRWEWDVWRSSNELVYVASCDTDELTDDHVDAVVESVGRVGVAPLDDGLTRPGFTYVGTLARVMFHELSGVVFRVDTDYLDPQRIYADEDMHALEYWAEHRHLAFLPSGDVNVGAIGTTFHPGRWANDTGVGDDPAETLECLRRLGSVAYRGELPAAALTFTMCLRATRGPRT